jgi:homoserine kinase
MILALATRMEGHPDNVAACLAGGLTIAWHPTGAGGSGSGGSGAGGSGGGGSGAGGSGAGGSGGGGARVARLAPLPSVAPVLCVPAAPLPTVTARQVLPPQVPHADAAANSARAALLVTALTSQPDLLLDATEDFLHQGYRAGAMPATARLIATLRAARVPAVVSGAGPSVLALGVAGDTGECVAAIAAADAAEWRVLPLRVDLAGATARAS